MSMNKILVIGNVGNDPEMRYTPSGAAVTTFSLATNRVYTTSDGERREETEWFRVSAWGRLAEQCNNYVTKGRKVYAEGRLKSDTWTGNDGQPRVSLEINADRVIFLDRAGAGDVPGGATQGPAGADAPPGSGPTEDVDDLPW